MKDFDIIDLFLISALAITLVVSCSDVDLLDLNQIQSEPLELHYLQRSESQDLNLLILPEAYRQEDMLQFEGKAHDIFRILQQIKPYCYLLDRMNIIYSTSTISESNELGSRKTAYGSSHIDGRTIFLDMDSVKQVVRRSGLQYERTVLLILANTNEYVGCTRFFSDYTYAVCPADNRYTMTTIFHELGHAIGHLADEYAEYDTFPSKSALAKIKEWQKEGDYLNITTDGYSIPWKEILADPAYAAENTGVYLGGALYASGVYRSTSNSIMKGHLCGYNAVSRFLIYKRLMKFHTGVVPDYSDFRREDLSCNQLDFDWNKMIRSSKMNPQNPAGEALQPTSSYKHCIIRE